MQAKMLFALMNSFSGFKIVLFTSRIVPFSLRQKYVNKCDIRPCNLLINNVDGLRLKDKTSGIHHGHKQLSTINRFWRDGTTFLLPTETMCKNAIIVFNYNILYFPRWTVEVLEPISIFGNYCIIKHCIIWQDCVTTTCTKLLILAFNTKEHFS